MKPENSLRLDAETRQSLWHQVTEHIERYLSHVQDAPAAPELSVKAMRTMLTAFDFEQPMPPNAAVEFAAEGLWKHQVHTSHPRYFGLFNPPSTTMGIAADALVAAFNPQLAAWSHNPFANEIERHLIRMLGQKFGFEIEQTDGVFTSGGAEANHTALLTALTYHCPDFGNSGVRGLSKPPVLYTTAQSHHSLLKAARLCGLGTDAVHTIPTDSLLRMDMEALSRQIEKDKLEGFAPFFVAVTGGSTNAGVIDPIQQIGDIAQRENLWFHVDAAWGGAAAFVPEIRPLLDGMENADSITFDAHKWLCVPMGAGIYLTRHPEILSQTFQIVTAYMPKESAALQVVDPFAHSIQWSRRFIGLKLFLSLAVAGWIGYEIAIRHQTKMGDLLREQLQVHGWIVLNETQLPVICFADNVYDEGRSASFLEAVVKEVVDSGEAWISTTRLREDLPVIRACITHFDTQPDDIEALIETLNRARRKVNKRAQPR